MIRMIKVLIAVLLIYSCAENRKSKTTPAEEKIAALDLKKGLIISCGPPEQQLGLVEFDAGCRADADSAFLLGMQLLHSFEYDQAERAFAEVIRKDPRCAMAYWGVAMSLYHPLWSPPTEAELKKGSEALIIARSIEGRSEKASNYINALSAFYQNYESADHASRMKEYSSAMKKLHETYADDKEAAIFYALSLSATADPSDKTFAKQKEAGKILEQLYTANPSHPGIVHYIIHSYDYPGLAPLALAAAKKYASIAPSSAHALHMPSHIFTRLGMWDESIRANLASIEAARCYSEQIGLNGSWDEELHGLDYLVYAYLQKGMNDSAEVQIKYLRTINTVTPENFKGAYTFAAAPARLVLENKNWKQAAELNFYPAAFEWEKYPWQRSIVHLARVLGNAHNKKFEKAKEGLDSIKVCHAQLVALKDLYKAQQVEIMALSGEAWLLFTSGKNKEGIEKMINAANIEDKTEKHPVTPGEVLPARELLGDMYLADGNWKEALSAYEQTLSKSPNRFNSLYGAGYAAEKSGNHQLAMKYFSQLESISNPRSPRPELLQQRKLIASR